MVIMLPSRKIPLDMRRKTGVVSVRHAVLALAVVTLLSLFMCYIALSLAQDFTSNVLISSAMAEALESSAGNIAVKSLGLSALGNPSTGRMEWKAFPGAKAVVAYAISITSCPENAPNVIDGPAILGHSIHKVSIRQNASKYDYRLYAFVFPDAANCSHLLKLLGYEVIIRDIPFKLGDILSDSYKAEIEEKGCCGSREFVKLWAFTLFDHEIVVHTDTDVILLQPLDALFDVMLSSNASAHTVATMGGTRLPSKVDFLFTRDYVQRSHITNNTKRFGVQGGFFVAKPDAKIFQEMKTTILRGDYSHRHGWANLSYGGYWGSPQVQGFLSYFYGEMHPDHAVELNRCLYNTMVHDPPMTDGLCRTGEKTCEDCQETPLSDIFTVHLTTCAKPWQVSTAFIGNARSLTVAKSLIESLVS
jgi:hypothetical protein